LGKRDVVDRKDMRKGTEDRRTKGLELKSIKRGD
jgi:hypothetical protein